MKHTKKKSRTLLKYTGDAVRQGEIGRRLDFSLSSEQSLLLKKLGSSARGLREAQVAEMREMFGSNRVMYGKKAPLLRRVVKAFVNPFTAILFGLAAVSAITDIVMAQPGGADPKTVVIIMAMVMLSGLLRFVQETRSGNAAKKLLRMINTTTCVERRENGKHEIPMDDVVVGDLVHLSAGDMIPADMRLLKVRDLFVNQSALTGESIAVEKNEAPYTGGYGAITDCPNLAFMGSNVVSGSAIGIVLAVGNDTLFGDMARKVEPRPVQTGFEKGVNSVSWLLIRFMLVMVPVVLFLGGFTKGDWMEAGLFAISVAVGLVPEMLPMIVTACLSRGALAMARKKTIIKNLGSIQNLGGMDILCTDKTGTLTQNRVVLQHHCNMQGQEDHRVLRHAFLNSYFQTGLKNLLDVAIIDKTNERKKTVPQLQWLHTRYRKVDEIPFDFERRRMSVVVRDADEKTQMITKGAVEEILGICSYVEYEGAVLSLDETLRRDILARVDQLGEDGMRVIGVAQKTDPSPVGKLGVQDEADMVWIGYLAFLDPPKDSAAKAVAALKEHGVGVKILTGDNEKVARCICRQVGIPVGKILLGSDMDDMNDTLLAAAARKLHVFAKLSPAQKARIVSALRSAGHSVGYMGDGINDAAAMQCSDVGISVDTAVDIAKESADVILLEKDLTVLEKGIMEGRKTYANMMKYIKITASSNFGNMLSVVLASAVLPFLPMMSMHLLLLNLIYDLSCIAIPWDNVDAELLKKPGKWNASGIGRFMLWIGPASSLFDITTYLLMYFFICPMMFGGQLFHELTDPAAQAGSIALFQAGWFVESMWSQTLVIHMIRTPQLPFVKSRASLPLTLLTFTGIGLLTVIPFTGFGAAIGLAPLPAIYFVFLALTVLLYMVLATVCKKIFIRRYGELL